MFRSSDHGHTWQLIPVANTRFSRFVEDASGNIFALSQEAGIYRSRDDGQSWVNASQGLLASRSIYGLVVDTNGRLFAGSGGVHLSIDQGESWHLQGLGDFTIDGLTIATNGELLAGTVGRGVYRSFDHGNTWQESSTGLTCATIWATATNSKGDIFAANGRLFRSTNHGQNWQLVYDSDVRTIAIRDDDTIFLGVFRGILRSTDNGESWKMISFLASDRSVANIAFNSAGHVYISTYRDEIFASKDDGETWSLVTSFADQIRIEKLAIDYADRIYAIKENRQLLFSCDAGRSWETLYTAGQYDVLKDLAVVPIDQIYLGTTNGGLLYSPDLGKYWQTIVTRPFVHKLLCDNSGQFVAATTDGIFLSADGGHIWRQENSGMGRLIIWALIKSSDGYIYAGTQDFGIFQSRERVSSLPQRFELSQNYPNPFNAGTRIDFALNKTNFVRLTIFDMIGREISRFVNFTLPAGKYSVAWNGIDTPSGLYFYRFQTEEVVVTKKMLLLR